MQYIENGIRYHSIGYNNVTVVGFGISSDRAVVKIPTMISNGSIVSAISDMAFEKNNTIEEIVLPDTIVRIGERAFYRCINLTSVKIEHQDNVDLSEEDCPLEIHKKAFSGCKNLTKLKCNKPIILMGVLAFHNCILLPKIDGKIYGNLPDKSFLNCMSLEEFSFYDKETTIGQGCFEDCLNLARFYIHQDLELPNLFLEEHKEAKFFCGDKSKYLSLIHFGYKVMMFSNY